jgi:UDP:flavonoid glycosyltransferase YjiC (YdhE family)
VVAPAGSEQPLLAEACLRAGVTARFPPDSGDACAAVLKAAHADPALRSRAEDLAAGLLMDRPGRAADLVEKAAAGDLTSVR